MRILIAILLAAAPTLAGGILVPTGKNLGEFKVLLDLSKVDRSSPEALARSWGDLQVEEKQVADKFSDHFRDAHLAILDRYYSPVMRKAEERNYGLDSPAVNMLRCQFVAVETDDKGSTRAFVRRSWTDALGRPRSDQAILAVRQAKDGKWFLVRIAFKAPDGSVTPNPRQVPPPTSAIKVPQKFPEFPDTPDGVFKRLILEFRKLRFERRNAQNELNRHVFPLIKVLYGPEIAAEEKKNQETAKRRQEFFFRAKEAIELEGGGSRVEIMALDKAPDVPNPIAVGHATFDMKKDKKGRWRVVAEAVASEADKPTVPVTKKFGIFLMG